MQNALENLECIEPPAERFAGGHVKGSMVRSHLDWVRDHRDRSEVIEFFEAVPFSLRTVLSAAWYPFGDLIELDRIVMNRFGNGEIRFLQELGGYSARQNLTGVYRFFQRSGVHEFFHRAALLHRQFQNFGTVTYRELSLTSGQMIHGGYPSWSPLYCSAAAGFYRECIRMHGGVNVEVVEASCYCRGDDSCRFDLAWV